MTREIPAPVRRRRYFADIVRYGGTLEKLPTFGVCFGNILMMVVLLMEPVPALTTAQTSQQSTAPRRSRGHGEPTQAALLRGAYGPYRANNDLLFPPPAIRVERDKKFISRHS